MVKIAKNKSSNNKSKMKGVSPSKVRKLKGMEGMTDEEAKAYWELRQQEHMEQQRTWILQQIEYQTRQKKIDDEEFKKQLVALGYVFLPVEGQLVDYYLRNKILGISMDRCPIEEVDVYANNPQALAEKYPNTAEVWYFFTRSRANEIEAVHDVQGQWVICEQKDVFNKGEKVGVKLLLDYYEGGDKSKYKIIEYQLDPAPENLEAGHWFICKLYNGGCVDVRRLP